MSDEKFQCTLCSTRIDISIPDNVDAEDLSIMINQDLARHLIYRHRQKIFTLFIDVGDDRI